jgi:hypothetical protein
MQGYSKDSVWVSIRVHYNGYVEASIEGYSEDRVAPTITFQYIG